MPFLNFRLPDTARFLQAATVFCGLIIVGLFVTNFFRVLLGISTVGLTVTAVSYAISYRRIAHWQQWPVYGGLVLIFMGHLLAGFNTSAPNLEHYWRDVLLQAPLLVLPLSFWLLPALPARYVRGLWLLFFGAVVVASLGSTLNYLADAKAINQLYLQSKVMPTEPDHIRFSLMISLAIVFGLLWHHGLHRHAKGRPWLLAGVIWLMLFQHLLAVRSGLLAFYALGLVGLGWALWRQAWQRAFVLGGVLLLLPAVSYLCFPTFRNRFYNTQDDMSRVDHVGSANNYSLVGRVYSWKVTRMIIADHPLLGVGVGDMEAVMATKYRQSFPEISSYSYIKPHNQFLYWLVAFGGIGTLLLTLGFYFPLLQTWRRHAPLLLGQYLILTLSFLVEYTLETQVGLLFALLFILLSLGGLMRPATEKAPNCRDWYPT